MPLKKVNGKLVLIINTYSRGHVEGQLARLHVTEKLCEQALLILLRGHALLVNPVRRQLALDFALG